MIVGTTDTGTAFRWTEAGGFLDISSGGLFTRAVAASEDGSVVVGRGVADAFIWNAEYGTRRLRDVLVDQGDDLAGWTLEVANGISLDGRSIVGTGFNPNGQPEAWLATISSSANVPEPKTAVTVVSALIGVVGWSSIKGRKLMR